MSNHALYRLSLRVAAIYGQERDLVNMRAWLCYALGYAAAHDKGRVLSMLRLVKQGLAHVA